MKIKSLIANASILCLSLACIGLLGYNAALVQAAEPETPIEETQPSLALEYNLSPSNASTAPAETSNPTKQEPKKNSTRVKLRMSRSITNFEALNNKPAEAMPVDPASIQKETEAETKMLADGGVILEGDRMETFDGRHVTAFGNGVLRSDKSTITGDRIEYDQQDTTFHVVGNATFETPDSIAKGSELHLNTEDTRGYMKNSSFLMFQPITKIPTFMAMGNSQANQAYSTQDSMTGNYDPLSAMVEKQGAQQKKKKASKDQKPSSRGTAEMMFFEGENIKRFRQGKFTTCDVGTDDWYVKSNDIKINNEAKTVQASNARIEFKGVPVIYSPSMSFPYSGQRKTGFLSPLWGQTTKSGFELYTPYYINISPNLDATIGSRILSKRGIQLLGETRYLDENYSGIANIEYLANDAMTDQSRYFVRLKHQQTFGSGWSGGYQFEKVSDDTYFSELSTRIAQTSRVNLPQQANLAYSNDVWQFNIMAQRYQSLNNSNPYERLPQVILNGKKDWGAFVTDIKNQAVYFDLDDKNNTAWGTGTYAGNMIRPTGSRFSSYPSISMPLMNSYGYITPKLGLHYTQYNLDNQGIIDNNSNLSDPSRYGTPFDSSLNRTVPIFSLDSGLTFERDTKVMTRPYTQTLEPRLFYVYIPYRDQSLFPRFDSALADLNVATLFTENQFTGVDRVNNANQLSFAVTSRMIDGQTGEQRLSATLGQRFYFADQKVGLGYTGESFRTDLKSDIVGAATAKLRNGWFVDSAMQYNTDTSSIYRANLTARYRPEPGKVLNLTYRYLNDLNNPDPKFRIDQINISTQWPLGKGWYALGRWNYSIKDSNIIEGLAGLEYDAGCWQSRVVMQRLYTATAEANYAFFYQLEFGGMGSVGTSPFRILTRNIPGYTSTSQIPENYRQDEYE